jgi:putative isomerase
MTFDHWLATTSADRPAWQRVLLERAGRTLLGNIASEGAPWAPLRGIRPALDRYQGIWNWDAAFHALTVARWDVALAREQFALFRDTQGADGMYIDVWFMDGNRVDAFGKPPVWPWALARIDALARDDAFLATAYASLARNAAFWRAQRCDRGLFFYGGDRRPAAACICCKPETPDGESLDFHARLESGWDTSPRWDGDAHDLWAVDLNCFQQLAFNALAGFARRLGRADEAATWEAERTALAQLAEQRLWDARLGLYSDCHRHTGKTTGVLTPASFMPLVAGCASAERAARMAALAADPAKLFPGMPTVAYDHPAYDRRDYWRGPTWINVAWFAIRGLRRYGHRAVADEIAATLLRWFRANDHFFELYDSRTGEGMRAVDFGWSAAFAIELICDDWSDG